MAGFSIELVTHHTGGSRCHRMSETGLPPTATAILLQSIRRQIAQERARYAGTGDDGQYDDVFRGFDLEATSVILEGIGRLPNDLVFDDDLTTECDRLVAGKRRLHDGCVLRKEAFDADFSPLLERLPGLGFQEGREADSDRRWICTLFGQEDGASGALRGIVHFTVVADDLGEKQSFYVYEQEGKPGFYNITEKAGTGFCRSDGIDVPITEPERVIALFNAWAARIGLELRPNADTPTM